MRILVSTYGFKRIEREELYVMYVNITLHFLFGSFSFARFRAWQFPWPPFSTSSSRTTSRSAGI